MSIKFSEQVYKTKNVKSQQPIYYILYKIIFLLFKQVLIFYSNQFRATIESLKIFFYM